MMSERDAEALALANLIADMDGTGVLRMETIRSIAASIIAAGYHNGPRIPAPDTPEEAAAVERMAKAIHWDRFEDDDYPDENSYAMALAALRALGDRT
jgi:hypothetical protein